MAIKILVELSQGEDTLSGNQIGPGANEETVRRFEEEGWKWK